MMFPAIGFKSNGRLPQCLCTGSLGLYTDRLGRYIPATLATPEHEHRADALADFRVKTTRRYGPHNTWADQSYLDLR